MKKHLHNPLRALFLSLAVLLSLPMLAVEVEIDGIRYDLNAQAKQATVIEKSSGRYYGDVVIPETVEFKRTAHSVTSIGDYAFSECDGLTSVTIPNSVTSIGSDAFAWCSGLTSVHISDIAAWCNIDFADSYSNPLHRAHHLYLNGEEVKDLVIPNSMTSIGDYAFRGCSGLTSVTIPNSVTSIGNYAFDICSGLTSVTIPNSVTRIGDVAFWGCSGLTSVTIGNGVTSIGDRAFEGCYGLTSVTIGNSVESIGACAFSSCSKLLDVYCYAEKVPSTGSGAFYDSYPANPTLHVPAASVNSYKATAPWSSFGKIVAIFTEIDGINYDFDAVTKKATVIEKSSGEYSGEVVIPESVEHEGAAYSVTSIGGEAFRECSGLTSVVIPNSVTWIGNLAFDDCSGLTSVHISDIAAWCNIDFEGYYSNPLIYAHHLYLNGEEVKDLVIPNSVKSIGKYAFAGCESLTSVTIGNAVTSIGGGAFRGCSGLTSIVVEEGNPVYDSRNNCNAIIETESNILLQGCNTTNIPNSVTSIGTSAFSGCSGMTSVTIPNSVTSIGTSAFSGCSGLTSVTIPNSVTSIGDYATFWGCYRLTSVTIGNSVTSIGSDAFWGCSGLTSVTIGNAVTSIGDYAFWGCSGLTSVTIGNAVTSIGGGAFGYCSGLTSVTIPNSVTSINWCTFQGCKGLTSVTIPNSVTSIGGWAFCYCYGLTSVTIPNSVTYIGEEAFAACIELLDVYCYAEKVPTIKSNAFDGSYPEYATLHVPAASVGSYKATAPWSSFGKIVGLTPEETGIDELKGENGSVKKNVYDFSGRRVQNAKKGVYIQNGKVVMVR